MGNSPAFHRGRSQTGPRAHTVRPYGGKRTGRVGSGTQAQERDRPSSHFPKTQAPSGAGWNRTQALLILRAGNVLITSRAYPRKQGSGADSPCQGEMARRARGGRGGDYEHEVLILSRALVPDRKSVV